MSGNKAFLCSVCFKPVDLTICKMDEDGRAAHEKCHAERLLNTPPQRRQRKKRAGIWGKWRRAG
jgi:hypothetical protein